MKKVLIAATLCIAPVLGGCSNGIHYASEAKPANLVPPVEMRYVAPAAGYQSDLAALVGQFAVYNKADKSIQVIEPVAHPYDPRTKPVIETVKQTLYSSVVKSGTETDIPVLAAALKDANGEDLDVTIVDEAHAMVPTYSADILTHVGSRYRPTNANEEIVYIAEAWQRHFNAALLTATPHSRWSANDGVVVYNNKTYVRSENFKDGRYITVSAIPLANLVSLKAGQPVEALPASAVATIKPPMANPHAYTWHGDWRGHGWGYGHGFGHAGYYR
jgi:hypothetical protein